MALASLGSMSVGTCKSAFCSKGSIGLIAVALCSFIKLRLILLPRIKGSSALVIRRDPRVFRINTRLKVGKLTLAAVLAAGGSFSAVAAAVECLFEQ